MKLMRIVAACASATFLAEACLAAPPIRRPVQRPEFRQVAVTFDDLPAPSDSVVSYRAEALQAMTSRLLAELKVNHIPAIGFVNEEKLHRGQFDKRVDILKMWVNAGFELGNHTYSHVDLDTTPLAKYEQDFLRGEKVTQALLRARGQRERYFRYPFLDVGKTLETKRAFERFLKEQGYVVAPVTIDNEEYMFAAVYAHAKATRDTPTATRVAQSFLSYMNEAFEYSEKFSAETLGYEPRQILLLHADELDTDEMDALAKMMRARGYHFISLRTALRDPAYRLPDDYVDGANGGGVSWIEHWADTMGKAVPGGPDPPEYIQKAYQALQ
jgi:peptidoglycan/xylan/chitin deacetylase (PgdA/CDA1 family)